MSRSLYPKERTVEDVVIPIAKDLSIPEDKLLFEEYLNGSGEHIVRVSFRSGSISSGGSVEDKYMFEVGWETPISGLKWENIKDNLIEMEQHYLESRDRLTIYNDKLFFYKYIAKVDENIVNCVIIECPSCEWSVESDEYRQDLSGGGFLDRVLMSLLIESHGECGCTT